MLGARDLGKLAAYNVLISSGTLLGAIALQQPAVTAGALAYLVISTLGIAAFFLLGGLIVPHEEPEDVDQLAPYDPTGDALYTAEDERRVEIPAPVAILGICFLAIALVLAGLPPLSGFVAKFALLAPMVGGGPGATALFVLVFVAGLGTVISMGRAGVQIFWADSERAFPRVRPGEIASVLILLALCLVLTVAVAAPWRYLRATAQQVHSPQDYIRAVAPAVPGAVR